MHRIILIIFVFLLSMSFVTLGFDQQQGVRVYQQACKKCHGPEGKGDGPAAKMFKKVTMGDLSKKANMSKYSDQDLQKLIVDGGPALGKSKIMTAQKGKLTDPQVQAVIAYIKTLAK